MKTIAAIVLVILAGCAAEPAAEADSAPLADNAAGETESAPAAGNGAGETESALPADNAGGEAERACDASKAQSLLGKSESGATEAEAKRLSGAGIVRWIPEGGMVTMDYREDRLNLRLDAAGKIIGIDCG